MSSTRLLTVLIGLSLAAPTSVALAGARSSSFFKRPGYPDSTWAPPNLIDNDPKSAWMEGAEGAGEGSWIAIDLPRGRVNSIFLSGGHAEDERMYQKYGRAKDITLELYTIDDAHERKPVKQVTFTLKDEFGMQEVPIGGIDVGGELFGGELKVIINSVYEGKDFKDTVLGEVRILLDEYPAQITLDKATTNLLEGKKNPEDAKEDSIKGKGDDTTVEMGEGLDFGGGFDVAWYPDGKSVGQEAELRAPDYGLAAIVITTPEVKAGQARPKEVQIEVGSFLRKTITLEDKAGKQRIDFPQTNGYNGGHFGTIKVKILSVYGESQEAPTGLLKFRCLATNYSI